MSIQFITSAGVERNILGLVLMYVSNTARGVFSDCSTSEDSHSPTFVSKALFSVQQCWSYVEIADIWKIRCMPYVLYETS